MNTHVPDRTRVYLDDRYFVAMTASWWRIDRWLFWAAIRIGLVKRLTGRAMITCLCFDEFDHVKIEKKWFRVYEERPKR